MRRRTNVLLMLAHRLQRRPSIKTTLFQILGFYHTVSRDRYATLPRMRAFKRGVHDVDVQHVSLELISRHGTSALRASVIELTP